MNHVDRTLATIAFLVGAVLSGCSNPEAGESEHEGRENGREGRGEHDRGGREGRGEHDRDGREHHGGEGEESGAELALNQSYDQVRNGARLVLAYDAQSNSFSGTVKNTTDKILKRVRVEVHLSNGKELGPTTPADLGPGEERKVKLAATSKGFERWSAHPEVGSGEHGHGEGGGGEHGRKRGGEHKDK
jgi:hypothetical protein